MPFVKEVEPVKVKIKKKVFNDVYFPYLNNESRIQIYFGGSSSGKSVFLVQRAVVDVLKGGHNYLVCRAVARTVKHSVFAEFKKLIKAWGLWNEFKVNESDYSITCKNGYQILFSGLDDVEKMKSVTPQKGVFTRIWVEEATEVNKDDITQLRKRQRGGDKRIRKTLTLSFNPILKSHHLFETYFNPIGWTDDQEKYDAPDGSLSILRTWYIHNRFLTVQDVYDLENEPDEYFRDVYTYGKFGILGDVIFTNWIVADLNDSNSEFYLPADLRTNRRNGLDFGFSSDPAAMPATHYDSKKGRIYIYSELYEKGLTNNILAEEIKKIIGHWFVLENSEKEEEKKLIEVNSYSDALKLEQEEKAIKICKSTDYLTCDSAEPKSISELQQLGINALPAKKGKDSVNFGIDWLKRQKIIIHKDCTNSTLEFQQYQWKKDKDGNSLKIPVDKNNHIIDALRYAYESDMERIDPLKVFDSV